MIYKKFQRPRRGVNRVVRYEDGYQSSLMKEFSWDEKHSFGARYDQEWHVWDYDTYMKKYEKAKLTAIQRIVGKMSRFTDRINEFNECRELIFSSMERLNVKNVFGFHKSCFQNDFCIPNMPEDGILWHEKYVFPMGEVELDGVHLGDFFVHPSRFGCDAYSNLGNDNNYIHPHVDEDLSVCLGQMHDHYIHYMLEGDVSQAVHIAKIVLNSYNPDDAFCSPQQCYKEL